MYFAFKLTRERSNPSCTAYARSVNVIETSLSPVGGIIVIVICDSNPTAIPDATLICTFKSNEERSSILLGYSHDGTESRKQQCESRGHRGQYLLDQIAVCLGRVTTNSTVRSDPTENVQICLGHVHSTLLDVEENDLKAAVVLVLVYISGPVIMQCVQSTGNPNFKTDGERSNLLQERSNDASESGG